jgi:hypothetical protein
MKKLKIIRLLCYVVSIPVLYFTITASCCSCPWRPFNINIRSSAQQELYNCNGNLIRDQKWKITTKVYSLNSNGSVGNEFSSRTDVLGAGQTRDFTLNAPTNRSFLIITEHVTVDCVRVSATACASRCGKRRFMVNSPVLGFGMNTGWRDSNPLNPRKHLSAICC